MLSGLCISRPSPAPSVSRPGVFVPAPLAAARSRCSASSCLARQTAISWRAAGVPRRPASRSRLQRQAGQHGAGGGSAAIRTVQAVVPLAPQGRCQVGAVHPALILPVRCAGRIASRFRFRFQVAGAACLHCRGNQPSTWRGSRADGCARNRRRGLVRNFRPDGPPDLAVHPQRFGPAPSGLPRSARTVDRLKTFSNLIAPTPMDATASSSN